MIVTQNQTEIVINNTQQLWLNMGMLNAPKKTYLLCELWLAMHYAVCVIYYHQGTAMQFLARASIE